MAPLVLGVAGIWAWDRVQSHLQEGVATSSNDSARITPDRTADVRTAAIPVEVKPILKSETGDVKPVSKAEVVESPLEPLVAAAAPPPGESVNAARSILDAPKVPKRTRVAAVASARSAASKSTAVTLDVLGFSRHSFPVSEGDAVARLDVRRVGSATGDVSFRWHTADDSAIAGQDYVFEAGEVTMTPGQTSATLDVPIVADSVPENPKLLQVVIADSRGARVGPAGRAPVIIVDDD
jgi:hypothetical protein